MNNIIKGYYEKYDFPAIQKLYQILKENGHEHEMLKVKQVKKKTIRTHNIFYL